MRHQNGCGLTPRRTHAPRRRPCSRVSHEPFPASAPAGAPVAAHLGSVGGGRAASRRLALGVRADVVADAEEAALSEEAPKRRGKAAAGGGRPPRPERPKSEFEERVTEVRRVTKVVKGGKQISFRAVVIVGDKKGNVGVGVAKAKEVVIAVQKAVSDAKKNLTAVPVTTSSSVPHRASLKGDGAASVVIRPAKEGSGITAGGSVRTVLELAGYKNVNAKMLAGSNPLNNGRATLEALRAMRTPQQVAHTRGLSTEEVRSAAPPRLPRRPAVSLRRPLARAGQLRT